VILLPEKWYSLIGKKLRDESKSVTAEPLPRRWIDLIRYLDEQEHRRERERAQDRPQNSNH
jgi:hypothetical protein